MSNMDTNNGSSGSPPPPSSSSLSAAGRKCSSAVAETVCHPNYPNPASRKRKARMLFATRNNDGNHRCKAEEAAEIQCCHFFDRGTRSAATAIDNNTTKKMSPEICHSSSSIIRNNNSNAKTSHNDNHHDDIDEEELGALIYKSSRIGKEMLAKKKREGASSSLSLLRGGGCKRKQIVNNRAVVAKVTKKRIIGSGHSQDSDGDLIGFNGCTKSFHKSTNQSSLLCCNNNNKNNCTLPSSSHCWNVSHPGLIPSSQLTKGTKIIFLLPNHSKWKHNLWYGTIQKVCSIMNHYEVSYHGYPRKRDKIPQEHIVYIVPPEELLKTSSDESESRVRSGMAFQRRNLPSNLLLTTSEESVSAKDDEEKYRIECIVTSRTITQESGEKVTWDVIKWEGYRHCFDFTLLKREDVARYFRQDDWLLFGSSHDTTGCSTRNRSDDDKQSQVSVTDTTTIQQQNDTNHHSKDNNNNKDDQVVIISEMEWSKSCPKPKTYNPDPCTCHPLHCYTTCGTIGTNCPLYLTNEECGPDCPAGIHCQNKRFQSKEWKKLQVFDTNGKKGKGLKTLEDCVKGDFIVEYVGVAVRRESLMLSSSSSDSDSDDEDDDNNNNTRNNDYVYIMHLDGDIYIDALHRGGLARYINHSCEPNCIVHKWKVHGVTRVGIFALRDIEVGEELSFDYRLENVVIGSSGKRRRRRRRLTKCLCGSRRCRGTL